MNTNTHLVPHTTQKTSVIRILSAAGMLAALSVTTQAIDITWTNGTASYNDAARWSPNQIPGSGDNAINNNGTDNVVQINVGDPAWTVVDIMAGNDANGPAAGAFEQNGSTLNVNGWMRLGMTSNSVAEFTLNDGTLNIPGDRRLQTGEGANSFTVVNINGGTINNAGGGIGFNYSDGGWGGQHSATTLVTQTAGTINTGGDIWVGQFTGGVATYNLHGGAINCSNWFVVSRAGGIGTLNMDGGSILQVSGGQPAFIVGDRAGTGGGVGIFNFSGGTVATIGAEYWVGNGEAASGTNNMSGDAALTVNNWMAIGRENSVGELNISGTASVTKTGGGNVVIGTGGGVGGLGIINQNGGAFTVSSGQVWLGENGVANGFWNLNSGNVELGILDIAHANSANGTFSLNGGTLAATEVRKGGSTGTATFNFNGGTLMAREDNPTFMNNLTSVDIQAGGAVIDSQEFDVTVSSSLSDIFGSGGGLTKLGTGTLRLTGFDFYSGPTLINGGKLVASTASSASGNYTVADGAGFGVVVAFAGGQLFISNLTLGTSGATSLDFDLGAFGNPFSAPLNAGGTLAVNGTVTVNITDDLPQVGQFPLIQYTTKTGSGTFVLGNLPTGMQASIVDNTANNSIDLNITQVDVVRWDGQDGGTWDIGVTTNWVNSGTGNPAFYADGNPATFNDEALGTTLVNLTTTVSPNGVSAENSFLDYTLTGSGKISGPLGLTKSGTGTFTIQNTGGNDYTGVTRIEGGTLSITNIADGGSPSAIGASSSDSTNLVLAGGTLQYSGATASTDRGYSFSETNNAIQTDGNLAIGGAVSPAAGSVFLKTGPATLAYTKTGTNLLARGGGGGFGAYNVVAGTLLLDGTAGPQTNYSQGEVWIGGTTNSGASLVMSNSTLISSSWVALGRGNGNQNFLSRVELNDSSVNLTGGGFSTGFDAGLPQNQGFIVEARQEVTLNGNSAINVANGSVFIAERRGATATVLLNDTSRITNSAWAGIGIGANNVSILPSLATVTIADEALWQGGAWFSIGHEGGEANMVVKDNGRLIVGGDLNVTDVGASTGTLIAQDNAQITAGRIWVGKDNNASGVFTITNDATVVSMNDLTMAIYWNGTSVAPSNAIVNLAGGSLAVSSVHGNPNGTNGTFNFNGGTLIARNPGTPNFMFDLASINVMSGGAVIDSDANNIAIAEPLLDAGGGGGLTKLGSGALYLNGVNTYTGPTLVNEGALGGTGSIVSPVTVAAGGTLAPATSIGTLTINNTLALGGNAVMEITRDNGTPESDRVVGVSTLTYGGTLTVTNIGTNALQVGDTFDLFDAATINPAAFAQLNLPAGYTWDTSQLNANGSISVESIAPQQPEFDSPTASDGSVILGGTGGVPGGTYHLLSTTNVALPVAEWTRVSTNQFDGSGNFSLTNAIDPDAPQSFFLIEIE